MKQIFKSNLTDQESNKTKSNEKPKKMIKLVRRRRRRLHERSWAVVAAAAAAAMFPQNDTSENQEVIPRVGKRTITKNKREDDDLCNVCIKK